MSDSQSLKQWRRDKRKSLLEQRLDAGGPQRKEWNAAIGVTLRTVLPEVRDAVVGVYWPFKGEFNIRPLMHQLHEEGARPALPIVVESNAPLEFHAWHPDMAMDRGVYNIPIPKERDRVTPSIVIAPLVGFDLAGYRLGYGGGYYDRTLAEIDPLPFRIGVGYEFAKLETLDPQPYDIPMNVIVTESAVYDYRDSEE